MSSRLIVKNLPKDMTEGRLRKEFASQGTVSDCQLKYTPDGVFRKFAFVGFTTEAEAESARDYFDGTYMGTAKILVEVCRPLGDASKPRAWSKYSKDSSAFARLHPEPQEDEKPAAKKPKKEGKNPRDDPKWADFLAVQTKEEDVKTEMKAEGDALLHALTEQAVGIDATQALLLKGLPKKVKLGSLKEFIAPVRLKTGFLATVDSETAALLTFNRPGDLKRVLKRDGEFFGGFKLLISEVSLAGSSKPEEAADTSTDAASPVEEGNVEKDLETVADTGRIFVRNLSYFVTEEDLEVYFKKYGEIAEVVIPVDLKTQKSKGYGIVTFVFPEHAVKAFTQLDGTILQKARCTLREDVIEGRMLHLVPGSEKPGDDKKKAAQGFKDTKTSAQKALAASFHNWNTLFVGSGAVGDAMSSELGVRKGELLSAEGGASLGVRMALGETQIVRQTRKFLEENGVALDQFGKAEEKRSKTVILVKNLPARTEVAELREVFEKFGDLGRVLLPPSGVSGLVEFLEPTAAKTAFKRIAYTRFKSRPFFLEWAPNRVFTGEFVQQDEEVKDEPNTSIVKEEEDTTPPEPGTSLFVKNLNFETRDEDLQRKFGKIGPLVSASVATKANPRVLGERLSMGFGFVQYRKADHAKQALKELQGALLHNHALELRLSTRETGEAGPRAAGEDKTPTSSYQGDCTKILVRNIPFQATESELRELFTAFGDLRFVRMPRKLGKKDHRGFGFVDFSTKSEAGKAMEALGHSTHLYGRRLVLEWAKEDESLEDVRQRTNQHFVTGENRARKGKEKRKLMETLEGKSAA